MYRLVFYRFDTVVKLI